MDPGLKIAGVTDLRKRKRVEGEGKAQERERSLLLFRPLVEPFRNDLFFVIPEIFYRESKGFKTMDPGLKIAGVTDEG